jgi:thiosulfate dehydrogenase [quinone] large subunit
MTRTKTYVLTAASAVVYVLLCWIFADGLFDLRNHAWESEAIFTSAIWTYVYLALIVLAGVYQARQLPEKGIEIKTGVAEDTPGQVHDPTIWRLLTGNVYWAIVWLPLRFFVGQEWLAAGEHKVRDDAWMEGGAALKGYWERAVAIPEQGRPAITYGWYRDFLQYMLDHGWYDWFAKVIAVGEVLVGVGLVVGALVGIAAFFGTLMNVNFMLAGSASTNPVLFGISVLIILGWKVAGYWGLDRVLLPALGTPWRLGRVFAHGTPAVPPRPTANPA